MLERALSNHLLFINCITIWTAVERTKRSSKLYSRKKFSLQYHRIRTCSLGDYNTDWVLCTLWLANSHQLSVYETQKTLLCHKAWKEAKSAYISSGVLKGQFSWYRIKFSQIEFVSRHLVASCSSRCWIVFVFPGSRRVTELWRTNIGSCQSHHSRYCSTGEICISCAKGTGSKWQGKLLL